MPHASDCNDKQRKKFTELCTARGLDASSMSVVNMLTVSFSVIFGVLSSTFFGTIFGDVHPVKMRQSTILIISINLIIFQLLRMYVHSEFSFALFQHSEDGFKIVIGVLSSVKVLLMFLVTNFIMQEFLAEFNSSHLSAFEKTLFIWFIFLVIYAILTITGKNSPLPRPTGEIVVASAAESTHV
jgi:hypothetical protein